MADSAIGSLAAATYLSDASLLVVEQDSAALKLTGTLLKAYAVAAAKLWANQSEAWAVGTIDDVAVDSEVAQYNNNAKYFSELSEASASAAATSEDNSEDSAEDSEAYAIGKRAGTNVTEGDVAYNNNSKYYAALALGYKNDASSSAEDAVIAKTGAQTARTGAVAAQLAAEDTVPDYVTTYTNETVIAADNTIYDLTDVEYLTIHAANATTSSHIFLVAGSSTVQITFGDYIVAVIGDNIDEALPYQSWEISIHKGLVCCVNWGVIA